MNLKKILDNAKKSEVVPTTLIDEADIFSKENIKNFLNTKAQK